MKTKDLIKLLEKTVGNLPGTVQITTFTSKVRNAKAYQDTERLMKNLQRQLSSGEGLNKSLPEKIEIYFRRNCHESSISHRYE